MVYGHRKNPANVARGLKAAIHNDHVSEEAKRQAAQRLEEMGQEVPADFSSSNSALTSHRNTPAREVSTPVQRPLIERVASHGASSVGGSEAGYDSDSDTQMGDVSGADADLEDEEEDFEIRTATRISAPPIEVMDQSGGKKGRTRSKSPARVLGGYKATLKNPRVSGAAKEHAQKVLNGHESA
ncbi:hypothetical protein CPB83DRAFT_887919 [Crepidotus variabilis]|uniref:Uncharacterized protein n=1 Tax=Crepidotus variabilis TaxID=179855 RepID=A0A9P6E2W8_9AGAR|nr:hypothetical protein CPB83DRAFT_887919 [Crepidotus variabilis]